MPVKHVSNLTSKTISCLYSRFISHDVRIRSFSTTRAQNADFTHAIIGGGAVGLAIARRLAQVPNTRTILLERHRSVGTETSSRNSEVIHAGLYYGPDSLKTRLCLRGKALLYELCAEAGIPHRNCGKWIVGQDDTQMKALESVHQFAQQIGVPTRFLSREESARREPDVRAEAGVLESESTGIIDSHAYMQFLEGDFAERYDGTLAFGAQVTHLEAHGDVAGSQGWTVYFADSETGSRSGTSPYTASSAFNPDSVESITAETVINSAGLGACAINNMLFPSETSDRYRKPYFAKGSYYSYSASHPKPSTLVYPAPVPGHGGLGTHLTLDMAGRIRFGPDMEWVEDPNDLAPSADQGKFDAALKDIQQYLPGLQVDAVERDYSGIRPKLSPTHSAVSGDSFLDFYIRKEEGFEGFVNLLGIESPGLTSSLAIGEYVHELLYK